MRVCVYIYIFRRLCTGVLISPQPDQEGNKPKLLSEWREFPSAPCFAEKKNLVTDRVSMLLKSRAFLTCFRVCFLPGLAKDLSAPRQCVLPVFLPVNKAAVSRSLGGCRRLYLLKSIVNQEPIFSGAKLVNHMEKQTVLRKYYLTPNLNSLSQEDTLKCLKKMLQ